MMFTNFIFNIKFFNNVETGCWFSITGCAVPKHEKSPQFFAPSDIAEFCDRYDCIDFTDISSSKPGHEDSSLAKLPY